MALQSEISPPLVGDPNKDTKIDGETKSDDNESSQSTDEDIDLEEGEIKDDSGEEEEEEKKDCSLKEALDKSCLKSIEQLVNQAKTGVSPPKPVPNNLSPRNSPHKVKRPTKYIDHDQFENTSDQEDDWYGSNRKRKSKFDAKPIDYRMELEAYRGTPPSSPDREKEEKKRKRSSKKSKKKSSKNRKDSKGLRSKYIKDSQKFKICKFFKEGSCHKGADCPFSHALPRSHKKKELCKFYLSGHCNKGKDCSFMHNEFPCKFYHTGSECYAKEACRFSHKPLTEEMRRVLNDYLNIPHKDDDYDRKRRRSPPRHSPTPPSEPVGPPPKRTCLLGSPPRHIREAEETKRWQEEMHMQEQNHPSFKIHISPPRDNETPPPPFPKPNFYQETLPDSPSPKRNRLHEEKPPNLPLNSNFPPQKPKMIEDTPLNLFPNSNFPVSSTFPNNDDNFIHESSDERYIYEEEEEYEKVSDMHVKMEIRGAGWPKVQILEENTIVPFRGPPQQELDFTRDVKFDETMQFGEMESVDCSQDSSNLSPQPIIKKEEEEKEDEEKENTKEDKPDDRTTEEPSAPVTPIVIPSHLPKKQQELFKRIQQRDRNHALALCTSDVSNSPKHTENTDIQVKEEQSDKQETNSESSIYSSDDDDDDDDEVVTDVLKNLQKQPPPPVKPPVKTEPKPPSGLMDLFNKIKKTALEKKKPSTVSTKCLLENLLTGSLAPSSTDSTNSKFSTSTLNNQNTGSGSSIGLTDSKRTLLPDPSPIPVVKKEPAIAPMDPRLKNRDPRTLSSSSNVQGLPKINTPEHSVPQTSIVISSSSSDTKSTAKLHSSTELAKEEVPYKLHGIYTKPLNYTPYISATQSNPNLLKDPRLRKHMSLMQGKENGIDSIKKEKIAHVPPPKDVPPIPKLLLKYDKNDALKINIFESNPTPKPTVEESSESKLFISKILDPRMRRRESQNSSGSNTPPHLTIAETPIPSTQKLTAPVLESEVKEEKNWFLPSFEKAWHPPPLLEKQNFVINIKKEPESDSETKQDLHINIKQEPDSDSEMKQNFINIKQEPESDSEMKQNLVINFKQEPESDSEMKQSLVINIHQEPESDSETGDPEKLEIDENPPSSSTEENTNPEEKPSVQLKATKPIPPASHLPRAIADPRMAKLHTPLDSRRTRKTTAELNKSSIELKKNKQVQSPPASENLSDSSKKHSDPVAVNIETEPNNSTPDIVSTKSNKSTKNKTIPKKRQSSNRSEEKKKPVHRNRKTSMDYASPLNSCDDTSNKNLNYNNYNKRPRRTCTLRNNSNISTSVTLSNSVSQETTDFLSDNSNLDCDNSSDINLKDKFKTIDPTASPFC